MDGDFPRTTWGMLLALKGQKPDASGLEALCRRYWEPIHRYARAAFARGEDDAGDVTQEFFLWLLEADVLRKYVPERGSFRHFLKGVLRNFARRRDEAARRLKRGGGKAPLPLDDVADERASDDAEAAFEQAWREQVLDRAIERVRGASQDGLHALQWRAFEAYDLVPGEERPTYGELARRLEVKEGDVRNYLFAVRERIRGAVREELQDTVATARDLDDEWEHVVGG